MTWHHPALAARTIGAQDDEIKWLRRIVSAIDARDPDKPTSWLYRREQLVQMAEEYLTKQN